MLPIIDENTTLRTSHECVINNNKEKRFSIIDMDIYMDIAILEEDCYADLFCKSKCLIVLILTLLVLIMIVCIVISRIHLLK